MRRLVIGIFLVTIIIALHSAPILGNGELLAGKAFFPNQINLTKLNISLPDLEGKIRNLTEFQNGILLINFWATWCGYCVREMPDLIKLDKKMREQGVGMVVAIDVAESVTKVKAFLNEKGFNDLFVLLDLGGEVVDTFSLEGYPTTFLFKDGLYKENKVGMMTWDKMVSFVTAYNWKFNGR